MACMGRLDCIQIASHLSLLPVRFFSSSCFHHSFACMFVCTLCSSDSLIWCFIMVTGYRLLLPFLVALFCLVWCAGVCVFDYAFVRASAALGWVWARAENPSLFALLGFRRFRLSRRPFISIPLSRLPFTPPVCPLSVLWSIAAHYRHINIVHRAAGRIRPGRLRVWSDQSIDPIECSKHTHTEPSRVWLPFLIRPPKKTDVRTQQQRTEGRRFREAIEPPPTVTNVFVLP